MESSLLACAITELVMQITSQVTKHGLARYQPVLCHLCSTIYSGLLRH